MTFQLIFVCAMYSEDGISVAQCNTMSGALPFPIPYIYISSSMIYGLPEVLVTDNGSCFVSEQFKMFLSKNGSKHIISVPFRLDMARFKMKRLFS